MSFQIKSVEEATAQHGVKMLVYGEAKAGKTVLASTAPHPVIISAEKGLLSLRGTGLPVIEVESIAQLAEVYTWLRGGSHPFHTVALDSISDIAEVCISEELKRTKDGRAAYGELATKMMKIIRDFRDLPRHVYVIAKQEFDKDGVNGAMMYRPSMPGRELTKQLPYMFDEILQLFVMKDNTGQTHRVLRCSPDAQNIAGDRSGRLEPFEPAHLGHVIGKILA